MKEQIKTLRVKIDGLSQLVKELKPDGFIIPRSCIPEEKEAEDLIKEFSTTNGFLFINDEECTSFVTIIKNHQLEKCYDSLILAKAWLGKCLGELGEVTPYFTDGNRHELKDIEPTADKAKVNDVAKILSNKDDSWIRMNHIEKVDWLREEIKVLIDSYSELENNLEEAFPSEVNYSPILWLYYVNLSEARFHLGFELQKIKEENK